MAAGIISQLKAHHTRRKKMEGDGMKTLVSFIILRSVPDSNGCRRFCRPLTKPLIQPTLSSLTIIVQTVPFPDCDCKVKYFFLFTHNFYAIIFILKAKKQANRRKKTRKNEKRRANCHKTRRQRVCAESGKRRRAQTNWNHVPKIKPESACSLWFYS